LLGRDWQETLTLFNWEIARKKNITFMKFNDKTRDFIDEIV
jgi:hypothetical protein